MKLQTVSYLVLLFLLLISSFSFSQGRIYDRTGGSSDSGDDENSGFAKLNAVLINTCVSLKSMLPIIVTLILFAAAVVYVAGQILGAETRSRANVWATAMLTGAIIAVLIVLILPPIAAAILDAEVQC